MSIIERSNPLNLAYKIAVVTNAASIFGQITCKTLLKANALVIGIDEEMHDPSLTARPGTHFQFVQGSLEDQSIPEKVIKLSDAEFGKDYINVLINIEAGDGKDRGSFVKSLVGKMQDGSLVNILSPELTGGTAEEALQNLRDLTANYASSNKGLRSNLVSSLNAPKTEPTELYQSAKDHMQTLIKTEKIVKDVPQASSSIKHPSALYDVANVTLFLAGGMSHGISECVLSPQGAQSALIV